jgi:hypothetical protein
VLQDDGHLVGILAQQVLGTGDARRLGLEGDVEMMRFGQAAGRGGLLQRGLHDAAQGVLGHRLVLHQVFRRIGLGHAVHRKARTGKKRAE